MSDASQVIEIPPTEVVRERLATIANESRLLRKVLRIAKSRDEAINKTSTSKEREVESC